jgi:hypothetical protein
MRIVPFIVSLRREFIDPLNDGNTSNLLVHVMLLKRASRYLTDPLQHGQQDTLSA